MRSFSISPDFWYVIHSRSHTWSVPHQQHDDLNRNMNSTWHICTKHSVQCTGNYLCFWASVFTPKKVFFFVICYAEYCNKKKMSKKQDIKDKNTKNLLHLLKNTFFQCCKRSQSFPNGNQIKDSHIKSTVSALNVTLVLPALQQSQTVATNCQCIRNTNQ